MSTARIPWADLSARIAARLQAAGADPADATIVAEALVTGEADGQSGHGLSRVPSYSAQLETGKIAARPRRRVIRSKPGAIFVDADCGFAIPAIQQGLAAGIAATREQGVAGVAIGNSHHSGVAGHHAERAARAGIVALSFSNTPAGIAPWGGSVPLFGTNPVAIGFPHAPDPLVIDLSLSRVARGKVMVAAQRGESIPLGWAVDAQGQPTTDPKSALAGSMLPMGEAKGAALVLAVELLATAFTGAQFGFEASSFFEAAGDPPRIGQFFIVIDPAAFGHTGFAARVNMLLEAILAQPGARLPGMQRYSKRAAAAANGFILPPGILP